MMRPGKGWASNVSGKVCKCCVQQNKRSTLKGEFIFVVKMLIAYRILLKSGDI